MAPPIQETESTLSYTKNFFSGHIFSKLPYPTKKFTDQTIIVTGSNSGMGLEAARHFVRLDASKVIIAVRDLTKGEEAKESIIKSEKCTDASIIEVWKLDLASYASTTEFAKRATSELERLDVVVANAGLYLYDFKMAEADETTITVNAVSTMLMAIMLLPKLRETSIAHDKETVLTFTGSFVHHLTTFPEQNAPNIFAELADKKKARMNDRYNVSKTIELLLVRELATQMTSSSKKGNVVTSILNPGFVSTSVMRNNDSSVFRVFFWCFSKLCARTAEEGGRTLLAAAYGGPETHGMYLDNAGVGKTSTYITSEQGLKTQRKLWEELGEKLDKVEPGVMAEI